MIQPIYKFEASQTNKMVGAVFTGPKIRGVDQYAPVGIASLQQPAAVVSLVFQSEIRKHSNCRMNDIFQRQLISHATD
jgi:hypothetical protein